MHGALALGAQVQRPPIIVRAASEINSNHRFSGGVETINAHISLTND